MNTEINIIKSRVLEGMQRYMELCLEEGDCSYSQDDIHQCRSIVDNFLKVLSEATPGNEQIIMAAVKDAVIALNDLNEKCDYSLIETDQREDLAELIIKAAQSVGVGNGVDDITEEWRDW